MGFVRALSAVLLIAIGFFSVDLTNGDDTAEDSDSPPTKMPKVMNENLWPPYHLTSMKVDLYIVPVLKYDYDMLEPYIDEKTMEKHIEGHHESYRWKMMETLKQWKREEPDSEFARESILEIVRNLQKVPEKYRKSITNNGGGFVNHCFVWGCMTPYDSIKERQPTASLMKEIEQEFQSFDNFKEEFTDQAKTLFGSGYVWLSRKPAKDGSGLVLTTSANQDTPISEGLFPLLVLDVWEHAYYLQHQHRRVDYIDKWWSIVDWGNVDAMDLWWQKQYPQPKKEEL